MTQVKGRGDSYSNGLIIGFRMVQVAIGKYRHFRRCSCWLLADIMGVHRYYCWVVLLFLHCLQLR